ncbi:hypothetical protein [Helicobacter salomonis]|uniref:hypothetical protein n=1 Tax=Helicobacter salomonis TaxID=56878 RepID=UPI001F403AB0|nr:hypothetical protein [Helicobacter salomonis]
MCRHHDKRLHAKQPPSKSGGYCPNPKFLHTLKCLLILWGLCVACLVAKKIQGIDGQAILEQNHILGKVVKSVETNLYHDGYSYSPGYKALIVDYKGKWVAWWIDKQTLRLTNKRPDNYYGADLDNDIAAHNQAMSLKMYNLLTNTTGTSFTNFIDFNETLLSLKPLQGTRWQSATFDGPSVWLIDENTTQAIEVEQAFGANATLFNQINARTQALSAKNAPLLFGSFFKVLPKPCLDHFPSANPKAPDLYLVLNFDNSDLHYTNLYQRTKEILDKFPTIVKRYRVHVFALERDMSYCDIPNTSNDPLACCGIVSQYKTNPPCKALLQSYQRLKEQFHATSIKGACSVPDGPLAEEPKDSKKVADTGRAWDTFLFGIDEKHNEKAGYIDNNNPTPYIYNPKIGLISARDFLKSLDTPMGNKSPKKAQGLSAYKVVKKASLRYAPFQIVLLQDKQSREQSVWLYSPQAKLWFKPGRVRKLHKNDKVLVGDFKEEASAYNYVKAYAKPLKTFFSKAHRIDLVPKNAKRDFYVIMSFSDTDYGLTASEDTTTDLDSQILAKVKQGDAVHIILVGSLAQLPTNDCGDTVCDDGELDWVASTCFNKVSRAHGLAAKLEAFKGCTYEGDPTEPGQNIINDNTANLTDIAGMLEAQAWGHFNELLPDPDQE